MSDRVKGSEGIDDSYVDATHTKTPTNLTHPHKNALNLTRPRKKRPEPDHPHEGTLSLSTRTKRPEPGHPHKRPGPDPPAKRLSLTRSHKTPLKPNALSLTRPHKKRPEAQPPTRKRPGPDPLTRNARKRSQPTQRRPEHNGARTMKRPEPGHPHKTP
ncbi:early nodulin-75-like [Penaeus japonicus]|uniref:early nodulin-75-like n=1 Tax=Penaeus japonicus TaxID=27405 RepID=UPI001C711CA7|nr:early nodulin-75-like [Penaeus japonicus]